MLALKHAINDTLYTTVIIHPQKLLVDCTVNTITRFLFLNKMCVVIAYASVFIIKESGCCYVVARVF